MPYPTQASPMLQDAMMGGQDYVNYAPPPGGLGAAMRAQQTMPPGLATDSDIYNYMAQQAGQPMDEQRKLQMLIQMLQQGGMK